MIMIIIFFIQLGIYNKENTHYEFTFNTFDFVFFFRMYELYTVYVLVPLYRPRF